MACAGREAPARKLVRALQGRVERRKVFLRSSSGDLPDWREEILEDAAAAEVDPGVELHAGYLAQKNEDNRSCPLLHFPNNPAWMRTDCP